MQIAKIDCLLIHSVQPEVPEVAKIDILKHSVRHTYDRKTDRKNCTAKSLGLGLAQARPNYMQAMKHLPLQCFMGRLRQLGLHKLPTVPPQTYTDVLITFHHYQVSVYGWSEECTEQQGQKPANATATRSVHGLPQLSSSDQLLKYKTNCMAQILPSQMYRLCI